PSSAGQGHGMTGAPPPPPPPPPPGLPAVNDQTPTGAQAKTGGQKGTHAQNASSANKPPVPPRPSTVGAPPPSSAGQGHGMTGAPPPPPPPPPPGLAEVKGQTPTGAQAKTGDQKSQSSPKDRSALLNEIRQGVQLKKVDTHAQNASSDKSQPGAPNQSALLVDIQKGVKLKKVPENEKNVYSNSPKKSSLESAIDKRRQDQGYAESESESDWD
ncbi:MAG: hypothetical protein K2P90_02510, partial [Holosporales bacterium]|nr:hypothetical protein [Holosporales bacterium]